MTAPVRRRYRDKLVEILDRVLDTQPEALDAARDAVAAALASDHLVYVAGSGHSHLLAEEVFYRAGGIAAAQAILDPDLMLHLGAERSTLLELEEGRLIASNSGRNAYPIEMALAAKARGALTIAITSMRHATAITSRHGSGKLLYQVTDLVLDNGGEYGDAALIVGHDRRMGPTSTIAGVFILNAVLAEAVDKLAGIGVDVDVYQSATMQGAEAAAQVMIRRWQARIRGL